jgi:hypothetical protein
MSTARAPDRIPRHSPASMDEIPALRALAETDLAWSYATMLTPGQMDYMLGRMYSPETIAREMSEGVIWETAWLGDESSAFIRARWNPPCAGHQAPQGLSAAGIAGPGVGTAIARPRARSGGATRRDAGLAPGQ